MAVDNSLPLGALLFHYLVMGEAFPNARDRMRVKVGAWNIFWLRRLSEMLNLGVERGVLTSEYAILNSGDAEELDRVLRRDNFNFSSEICLLVGIYNGAMAMGADKGTNGWFGYPIKTAEAQQYVKKVKDLFQYDWAAIDGFTLLF